MYDGRNKAFFFVNYEEVRLPNNFSRTRTVLDPRAQQGWFRYNVTVERRAAGARGQRAALAAANGQLATIDPTVARVFGFMNSAAMHRARSTWRAIRSSTITSGRVPATRPRSSPSIRLDYNLGHESPAVGHLQPDLGRARSRSPEQQRSPLPDVDQLRQVHVDPSDAVAGAALHARRRTS